MAADERDEMLRELAKNRGLKLVKSRRRKPGTGDYGRFGLTDAKTGKACLGFGEDGLTATAEEIESYLRGAAEADWKKSLSVAAAAPAAKSKRRAPEPEPEPEREPRIVRAKRPPPRLVSAAKEEAPPKRARVSREPAPKPEPPPKPKPQLVIREAGRKDAAAIEALIAQSEPSPGKAALAKAIDALARGGVPVLVADEEQILGVVSYAVVPMLHHAKPLGRVSFLLTTPHARRRGIGTALLNAAEERLRRLGCGTVELVNNIELSNANSFLRGHDYQRSGYRFARPLGED